MHDKPLVWVFEDNPVMRELCEKLLGRFAEFVFVKSVAEGREFWNSERRFDFHVVAFDGFLEDGDSLEFLKEVCSNFSGPRIAMSGDPDMRQKQMKAGCSRELADKLQLPALLAEVLELNKKGGRR